LLFYFALTRHSRKKKMKKTTTNIHDHSRKYTKLPDMIFHCADRARKSSAKSSTWDNVHNLYTVLYQGKGPVSLWCRRSPFAWSGIYRDEPGLYRDEPGLHRGRPGWTGKNRGSTGKVLKCLIPPGVTGNDRRGTGNNWGGTGNNRDGTVAPPGPIQTPAELRQRPVECR